MDKATLEILADTKMPPQTKWKFRNFRESDAEIARLECALGLERSQPFFNISLANARIQKLQALLAANAAVATATSPPAATPPTIPAKQRAPSLAVLRELERAVFGGAVVGKFAEPEAKQLADLTRVLYERNLHVPGLDYSALQSSGAWRRENIGLFRAVRATEQALVDKFFNKNKPATKPIRAD